MPSQDQQCRRPGSQKKKPSVESSRLGDSTSFQPYQLRDPDISHVSPRKAQKPLDLVAINKGSPLTGKSKSECSSFHWEIRLLTLFYHKYTSTSRKGLQQFLYHCHAKSGIALTQSCSWEKVSMVFTLFFVFG